MSDIYNKLKATGLPLSNWCSDLFVEVNEQSTATVNAYEYKCNVTKFNCEVTGKPSYEIPFTYDYKKLGNL